jgi:hypothetical protein
MPKKGNKTHSATDLYEWMKPTEYQWVYFACVTDWVTIITDSADLWKRWN